MDNLINLGKGNQALHAQQDLSQFDLALTYAFRGKKESALGMLRMINNRSSASIVLSILLPWDMDLMPESIRDDPDFQQIIEELNMKSRAEQKRIRQWLEEHEML